MFDRRSRYYRLPDVVVPDELGRPRAAKALRRLPLPAARMVHTIDANDRLDHLAYTYYRQSRRWWHIADANPAPLSPLALLGRGAELTLLFECEYAGGAAPWHALFAGLLALPGVSEVVRPVQEPSLALADAGLLAALDPALAAGLPDAVLAQRLDPALGLALAVAGIALSLELRIEQLGPASFLLWDRQSDGWLRLDLGAALDVFALLPVQRLTLRVECNAFSVEPIGLRAVIEAQGFAVLETRTAGRIGKTLSIPARSG
jgi:hypothetical protein